MTWPSSARSWSCAIGFPRRAGSSAVVLNVFMSPPRPWRDRKEDEERPSQRHPPGRVEPPEVGTAARLGPEVVPSPTALVGRVDFVFTVPAGVVVVFDDPGMPGLGRRGPWRA